MPSFEPTPVIPPRKLAVRLTRAFYGGIDVGSLWQLYATVRPGGGFADTTEASTAAEVGLTHEADNAIPAAALKWERRLRGDATTASVTVELRAVENDFPSPNDEGTGTTTITVPVHEGDGLGSLRFYVPVQAVDTAASSNYPPGFQRRARLVFEFEAKVLMDLPSPF